MRISDWSSDVCSSDLKINQSSCNKDFSRINGFCPSFVTVHGGRVKRARVAPRKGPGPEDMEARFAGLPAPETPALDQPYNILITGIGGTGAVTIGQILGLAANLEGFGDWKRSRLNSSHQCA